MSAQIIRELDEAARVVLAPPTVVTSDQRHQAENVFLSFRKNRMPYQLCKEIMESTKNDYVLFQIATTLKESVVREWSLLQSSDISSLRTFLLHFVTQNMSIQSYVREQILQTVAVIIKRGTIDTPDADKETLFNDVTQLISSGNISMQMVACSILTALLNEYSSTNRSSSVGLSWEFHSQCKMTFEQADLKRVFTFCLQVLQELEPMLAPGNREVTAVFNRFLSIMEQVLNWEFIPKNMPRRMVGRFMGNQSVSFKPPASWNDLILDKGLIDLLFKIHKRIRHHSEMAHHSLQCLSQLASLNGSIFENQPSAKSPYLVNYVQGFLNLMNSIQINDYEALGISTIVNSLIIFYPTTFATDFPPPLLEAFLAQISKLACSFGQAAASEEALSPEDTLYMESYEKLLDAWLLFIDGQEKYPIDLLKRYGVEVFNKYIQCHLSPPDGTRGQNVLGAEDDDELNELDQDDRVQFADQLCSIGALGRLVPEYSIPLISRLLEERVGYLQAQLQKQQTDRLNTSNNTIIAENNMMSVINEDLHWLLLIACSLLTIETVGEVPLIPQPLMKYTCEQARKTNMNATLKLLSTPGEPIDTTSGIEQYDPIVRLVSDVLHLSEVEKLAIDAGLTEWLSPQVGQSVMWFLKQWLIMYLLPDEALYSQISPALNKCFGCDTDAAKWLVSYLLEKVVSNLQAWSSEPALIDDSLSMLTALVDKKEKCEYVVRCPCFAKLASDLADKDPSMDRLPPNAKKQLYKSLVYAGSASFVDANSKNEYWKLESVRLPSGELQLKLGSSLASQHVVSPQIGPVYQCLIQVLESLDKRLKVVMSDPNIVRNCHAEGVRLEVISLLDAMCGVAEACRVDSINLVFSFLHPQMLHAITLLDLYHNYDDIVPIILELFNVVANHQLCHLGEEDTIKLFDSCLKMISVYSKHNIGSRYAMIFKEDEQFKDLLSLMEMLVNLLSKDFIDFAINGSGSTKVSAADVVLYGLNIVVPLMTLEILKFPALCSVYFQLLTYLAEVYPEKVCQLPEAMFQSIINNVQLGITSFGTDSNRQCYEFVNFIAEEVFKHRDQTETQQQKAMAHLLKLVMQQLLLETFDMDLLDSASDTLFSLICCQQEYYKQLVMELLSQQTESELYDRLVKAFEELTPPTLKLVIDRPNRVKFMKNFDKFLTNVRGFLCLK